MSHVTTARLLIALAVIAGGGSLALFAGFLFFGPFGLLDLGLSAGEVLIWDGALVVAFCVQHSVLIRRSVRRRIERLVPAHAYGVFYTVTSAVMILALLSLWQESAFVAASVDGSVRWLVRGVFLAALPGFWWCERSIPGFDPLGIGPVAAHRDGAAPKRWPFAIRGPYRWIRHPQYFFTLIVLWASPDLTADRLLLNGILTVWIVLGTVLEERDLVVQFGDTYVEYQRRVPMLIPWRGPLTR